MGGRESPSSQMGINPRPVPEAREVLRQSTNTACDRSYDTPKQGEFDWCNHRLSTFHVFPPSSSIATLKMTKNQTFKPHKHITLVKETNIAQESWIVVRGSVKCILYDIDDTVIAEPILYSGDASFTLEGGHNYYILEDDTFVYEYKTGPYEGQQLDKVFLEK